MNIFYINEDPKIASLEHCDKHAVKMCVEYAQLLSTAHRLLDGKEFVGKSKTGRNVKRWKHPMDFMDKNLMLACHTKHPSAIWCRQTRGNYSWLLHLLKHLLKEFTYRYGKRHSVEDRIPYLNMLPQNINMTPEITEMPQCMPEYCKIPNNPLAAYKNYYIKEKTRFATWKNREIPKWFQKKDIGI